MTVSLFGKRHTWLGKVAATAVLAVVLTTAIAGPALADRDGDHDRYHRGAYDDREWRWHERHARDYYVVHPRPIPRVVYAPPVVYEPPPQPAGLSLFFPLDFH